MLRAALCLALALALSASRGFAGEIPFAPAWLASLPARSLGPGHTSGRVTSIAGVESDPDVVYVGAAGGGDRRGNPHESVTPGHGVYRSVDGGKTWTHLGLAATLADPARAAAPGGGGARP